MKQHPRMSHADGLIHRLSPDESAVVACLIDGLTSKQIGEAMGWSFQHAQHRMADLYRVIGARNAHHAVALAMEAA